MVPSLMVFDSAETLAHGVAERFIAVAREAIALRGRFTVALAGGTTPKRAYEILAEADNIPRVPWPRTFVFFGDERLVPYDAPESNVGMARAALLSHVPLPPEQIFPIPVDAPTPEVGAAEYQQILKRFFDGPPLFDLLLLGVGDDGHTASLFPGAASLGETQRYALATPPGELPPALPRITLTYPALNAARRVLFIASGPRKAIPITAWLSGESDPGDVPAAGVDPASGNLELYADRAAAGDNAPTVTAG